ncbi:MAG: hypothetical protein M3Q97_02495, partial [Bacteroidota bacterium]|nr:hypothetical protein [Bacteroidota bacterium]
LHAQQTGIGQWRSHLDYSDGLEVVEAGDRIFCGTRIGLFSVSKFDNSLTAHSKHDGFSDVFISQMDYYEDLNVLCIGYQNANIDLVYGNKIVNIRNLADRSVAGIKQINSIDFNKDTCYISTSFGLVEYNLKKQQFGESYFTIGNVNQVANLDDSIFAATNEGIYKAIRRKNVFLHSLSNWELFTSDSCEQIVAFASRIWGTFQGGTLKYRQNGTWITYYTSPNLKINNIEVCHGRLVVAAASTFAINSDLSNLPLDNGSRHAILDKNNTLWMATNIYPCVKVSFSTDTVVQIFRPNGPFSSNVYSITAYGNEIWVGSGGLASIGAPFYTGAGIYHFDEYGVWRNYGNYNVPGWTNDLDAILDIEIDPVTRHKWLASATYGLVEFHDGKILNIYNASNSTLKQRNGDISTDHVAVSGLVFDYQNNLWISNFQATSQLARMKRDRSFQSFSLGSRNWGTSLIADTVGQIWLAMPRSSSGAGIYVYDPVKNRIKSLDKSPGNGNLPTTEVNCMVSDKKGYVWVGTNDGVAVFYNPYAIFTNGNFDATKIRVPDGGYLLEGEVITSIAVDGANRKWIGTARGVWLTTPEGTEIILHFTADYNPVTGEYGPLISNNITSIAVNGKTGEVFFGTDKGIQSYRSTATEGTITQGPAYAFPNPVKPDYAGPIAIRGLVSNASVKITDVTGALVYETTAEGGQAIWYGKNFNGEDAASGVYLVMSTNEEGSETLVTKILIVR